MASATATPPAAELEKPPKEEPREPTGGAEAIHVLLGRILAELPAIGKTDYNEQQKFHFRSHDAVLNALNPLLAKYGIVPVPEVLQRISTIRATRGGAAMYEVDLHVSYRLYGPAGDYVTATAWGEGTDMGDKATNKAMTMAFKNVLAQVFAVSTADTVDSDSQTPEETVHPTTEQARPPQPPARTATEAVGMLGDYALAPEPWVREGVEALAAEREIALADGWTWADLAEPERATATERLWKVVDKLGTSGLSRDDGTEKLQAALREAFTEAFGREIAGPDNFEAPIPF